MTIFLEETMYEYTFKKQSLWTMSYSEKLNLA